MRIVLMVLAGGCLFLPSLAGATTGDPNMSGHKEHAMANCPSTVPSAKTRVESLKEGVALTVTAPDAAAQREIRRRAEWQANVGRQADRGALEHTGQGTGSGKYGYCPGMVQGTRVQVDSLPNGARLTVRAPSEHQARQLQQSTRERLQTLPTP